MNDAIVPIILAVVAAAPGLIALAASRKKARADMADTLVGTAGGVVKILREQLEIEIKTREELSINVALLTSKVEESEHKIELYQGQINELVVLVNLLTERIKSAGVTMAGIDTSILKRVRAND